EECRRRRAPPAARACAGGNVVNANRFLLIALIGAGVALAGLGAAVGYWARGNGEPPTTEVDAQSSPAQRSHHAKPLYYQDPDGKPIYSATAKKTPDGRDFKPVYGDSSAGAPASSAEATAKGSGKILYYRNPMGLA